jgi:hypothetical protein
MQLFNIKIIIISSKVPKQNLAPTCTFQKTENIRSTFRSKHTEEQILLHQSITMGEFIRSGAASPEPQPQPSREK